MMFEYCDQKWIIFWNKKTFNNVIDKKITNIVF